MSKKEKTAAIVCEQYKLRAFKRKLEQKKFEFEDPIEIGDAVRGKGLYLIRVKFTPERLFDLKKVCKTAQIDAKLSN